MRPCCRQLPGRLDAETRARGRIDCRCRLGIPMWVVSQPSSLDSVVTMSVPGDPTPAASVPRWFWIGTGAAAVVAAIDFVFLQLASQSLFVDEALTWGVAGGPLSGLSQRLKAVEITPPLYYFLLHGWMRVLHSQSPTVLRLPSALCAVALVVVVCWIGFMVAGPIVGLCSGILVSISPAVITFGQQARAYAPAMLSVSIAVGCALRAHSSKRNTPWLIGSAAASAISVSLHYSAWPIVAVLCGAIALTPSLGRAVLRGTYVLICGLAAGASLPWLTAQLHSGPSIQNLGFSVQHVAEVVGGPFIGRAPDRWFIFLGAAIVLVVLALHFRKALERFDWAQRLLIGCAIAPLLVLFIVTATGHRSMLARYTAVADPLLAILVVWAASRIRRQLVLIPLGVGLVGCVLSHRVGYSYYGDVRTGVDVTVAHWRVGDAIVNVTGDQYLDGVVSFYLEQLGIRGDAIQLTTPSQLRQALEARHRVWALTTPLTSEVTGKLDAELHISQGQLKTFARLGGAAPIDVVLVSPPSVR